MNSITPVLDRIGQWLTGAPLWVQTPLVMVVVLLICVPLAAVLLKIVNTAGNLVERATGGGDGGHTPTQLIPRSGEGTSAGVRVVSRSEPEIPGD